MKRLLFQIRSSIKENILSAKQPTYPIGAISAFIVYAFIYGPLYETALIRKSLKTKLNSKQTTI